MQASDAVYARNPQDGDGVNEPRASAAEQTMKPLMSRRSKCHVHGVAQFRAMKPQATPQPQSNRRRRYRV